jgi:hypothetical protein
MRTSSFAETGHSWSRVSPRNDVQTVGQSGTTGIEPDLREADLRVVREWGLPKAARSDRPQVRLPSGGVKKLPFGNWSRQRTLFSALKIDVFGLCAQIHPGSHGLTRLNWLHAYDGEGRRQDWAKLPRHVDQLGDAPYRSLTGEVRHAGGYAKSPLPYTEFLWADFFRDRIRRKLVTENFPKALTRAVRLARCTDAYLVRTTLPTGAFALTTPSIALKRLSSGKGDRSEPGRANARQRRPSDCR